MRALNSTLMWRSARAGRMPPPTTTHCTTHTPPHADGREKESTRWHSNWQPQPSRGTTASYLASCSKQTDYLPELVSPSQPSVGAGPVSASGRQGDGTFDCSWKWALLLCLYLLLHYNSPSLRGIDSSGILHSFRFQIVQQQNKKKRNIYVFFKCFIKKDGREREREKWVGFGVISQHPLLGACGGASVFSVSLSRPACGWGRLKFSWNMQQQQQPTLTRRIHLMDYRQCVCVCLNPLSIFCDRAHWRLRNSS